MSRGRNNSDLSGLRVAVSGHRGFIGRHLTAALEALDVQVVLFEGDIRSPETWQGSFDCLCHLAAVMPNGFATDPGEGYSVNIGGTLQALEACRSRGAKMVFASTCGVYDRSAVGKVSEDSPATPQTPYAQSKLIGETLCRTYAEFHGVPSTILRLFNIYGPGQRPEFIIPYLLGCALERRRAIVRHPGSTRDFVYISDVITAFQCAIPQNQQPYGVINIGSGLAHSVQDVITIIEGILGRDLPWERESLESPDPLPAMYADADHSTSALQWTPRVDLERGIRNMLRVAGGQFHGRAR